MGIKWFGSSGSAKDAPPTKLLLLLHPDLCSPSVAYSILHLTGIGIDQRSFLDLGRIVFLTLYYIPTPTLSFPQDAILLSTAVAALPALASAQDFQQYQAQFQDLLGQISSYVPNPGKYDHASAQEAKNGPLKLHTFTLENWNDTLYGPVAPTATVPEEWWVLVTGRNKTCFGHCNKLETAFNESARQLAPLPDAPHPLDLRYAPPPAEINIYKKRVNLTTASPEDFLALKGDHSSLPVHESWFHPYNGQGAKLGLTVPFGYFTWAFALIPSWLFMLVISFFSRSMMSRRMEGHGGAPPRR
uniref:Uncharacterized protein n=1 Tax=Bionectria ochroleuca TaxID=29856 RepID=A0A8H7TVD2_BIOOC